MVYLCNGATITCIAALRELNVIVMRSYSALLLMLLWASARTGWSAFLKGKSKETV